jgi:hypothetical protein
MLAEGRSSKTTKGRVGFPNLRIAIFGLVTFFLVLATDARADRISVAPGSTYWALLANEPGALDRLRELADAGDTKAMTMLGAAHFSGYQVEADPAQARAWFARGAEAGDRHAMRSYAEMLAHGLGGRRNTGQALAWFQKAAAAGDALASYKVGRILEQGWGHRRPDYQGAADAYWAAWEAGLVQAGTRLGFMHLTGEGMPKDAQRAVALFEDAAALGYAPAKTALARQHYLGEGTLQNYSAAYSAYRDAATVGDPVGMTMSAFLLAEGLYQPNADPKAIGSYVFNNFMIAAGKGNPQAQYNMARLLLDGSKADSQRAIAHALFNLASVEGFSPARAARTALERRMTAEEIARAQHFAQNFPHKLDQFKLEPFSTGTGFLISIAGALVTNHHVVDGCAAVFVRTPAGPVPAEVVLAQDTPVDIALLRLRPGQEFRGSYRIGTLAPQDQLAIGEQVTVYGFPRPSLLSKRGVLSTGTLSALEGLGSEPKNIQFSAPIQKGNSGGALLNEGADVIGVVHSGLKTTLTKKGEINAPQNVNFGTKISVLRQMLEAIGQPYYSRDGAAGERLPVKRRAEIARDMTRQILCMVHQLQMK